MSEDLTPETPSEAIRISPRRRKFDPVPVLFVVGFAALAGALAWLYQQSTHSSSPTAYLSPAARIELLDRRVSRLEQQLPPAVATLSPLERRIAALEMRPQAVSPAAAGASAGAMVVDQAISDRITALTSRMQTLESGLADHVADLDKQIAAAQQAADQVRQLAQRAGRLAQLQRASVALELGRPLGELADAPPALRRFASAAPPTEAGLRLRFPQAAAKTRVASRPDLSGKSFAAQLWIKMQRAVTIRRGDRVVVGDPASGVLAEAQAELDAGDLAGAVQTLGKLDGAAAEAMAEWKADAQALLDARSALADAEQRA